MLGMPSRKLQRSGVASLLEREAASFQHAEEFRGYDSDLHRFLHHSGPDRRRGPLTRGAAWVFGLHAILLVALALLGYFSPELGLAALPTLLLLLPHPLGCLSVALALGRRRRDAAMLDELAALPFPRAAARLMIMAPVAAASQLAGALFAPGVFVVLVGCAAAVAPKAHVGWNLGIVAVLALLGLGCYAVAAWSRFVRMGTPAGWHLATRYSLGVALALSFALGLRILLGFALLPLGCLALMALIGFPGPIAVFLAAFSVAQAVELGYLAPRRWAAEDARLLEQHGVELVHSPEEHGRLAGRPGIAGLLGHLLWPWPRRDNWRLFAPAKATT
jgi:hypothetical protein